MEMKVAEVALATALAIIVFPGNWSVVIVVVVGWVVGGGNRI